MFHVKRPGKNGDDRLTLAPATFDAIILGQGFAGTAIAWTLAWHGRRALIVDRDEAATSSKVAAGLVTPVTGQKIASAWRFTELWDVAKSFYRRVETETGTSFFRERAMVRLFATDLEVARFTHQQSTGALNGLIHTPAEPLLDRHVFKGNLGGFEMSPGGQLNAKAYLTASRDYFTQRGSLQTCDLDVPRDVVIEESEVQIPRLGVRANQLIFCQGSQAVGQHWFRDVRFKPAKGEILTLRIPGLAEERVIHRGVWLAPLQGELFQAGATYDWHCQDGIPTRRGHDEIISKLSEFLRRPVEVVAHEAAVRPIHRNQFPVIGTHPAYPQLSYFNGLGSKGVLQAPYFARQLVAHLLHGEALDRDVDLNRKTSWTPSTGNPAAASGAPTTFVGHVEQKSRRPLTELAQAAVGEIVRPGDTVVDATAGNGHDTQFLAERVGPGGRVLAFDIQRAAIENTSKRLQDAGLENVDLFHRDHGQMSNAIPVKRMGRISAVMFNLGYLPGGDKAVITRIDSTRAAILQAATLLCPGGVISIVAYSGHSGGQSETKAVEEVLDAFDRTLFAVEIVEGQPGRTAGPRMFLVKRIRVAGVTIAVS